MYLTLHIEESGRRRHDNDDDDDDSGDDTTTTMVSTARLKVSLKQLEFTHHRSVLNLLGRTPKRPAGTTILGLVQTVMEARGWARKKPYSGNNTTHSTINTPAAVPQAPCIQSYRLYHLLAIDARTLERLVQHGLKQHQPEKKKKGFSIEQCMTRYCEQYQVHRGKTFPSLRHDIANHAERMDGESGQERRLLTMEKNKKIKQRVAVQQQQPFIYDNDEIHGEDEDDSDNGGGDVKKEKKRYNRRTLTSHDSDREWTRLIPVAILPLFMAHLPPCFTHVNEMMYACEMLESRLWQNFTGMTRYPSYLTEQVNALGANRRYMTFVHQQAHLREIGYTRAATTTTPKKKKARRSSTNAMQVITGYKNK